MHHATDPEIEKFEAGLTRRRPVLAILGNLFFAPLGHVYVGQAMRGFLMWAAFVIVNVIAAFFMVRYPGTPSLLVLGALIGVGFGVLLADAVVLAMRSGATYEPRPYNRWYVYLAVVVGVLVAGSLVRGAIRTSLLQAYRLPSESMSPTLLVGDYLFVDKTAQGRRGFHRGDIVVVPYPGDPTKEFMKRIVGLPNETIEIRDKRVYIDGQPLDEPYAVHRDPMTMVGKYGARDTMKPFTLGPGDVFLMGDNRDNSNDSRFWGPLPQSAVRGRAIMIYWSWDGGKFTPRWDRVGMRIGNKAPPKG